MAIDTTDLAARERDLERLVRSAQRGDRLAMAELMDLPEPHVARGCGPISLQKGPTRRRSR